MCFYLSHYCFFNQLSSAARTLSHPFSFPLAPFRVLLPRPLPHLPNKVPTRNKASLSKAQQPAKPPRPFLFSSLLFFLFPPGSVCAHQPVGLCFRACLCLDRFMKLCGICQNKKGGDRRGRQVSGVTGFYGREMQNELRSENAQSRFMISIVTCPWTELMLNKFAHSHRASKIIRGGDIIKFHKCRHRLSLRQSVGIF